MSPDPADELGAALAARWQVERAIRLDTDTQPHGRAVLLAELAVADEATRPGLLGRLAAARAAERFRREQAGLVPAPFPDGDPRAGLRLRLGELRTDLARHLAWAAAESEADGVPADATLDDLRALVARVRELDLEVWGPVVDPWAHLVWPAPRTGHAPWVGGATLEPDPGDVAVLRLLGTDASWERGSVVVSAGAAAAEGWGYGLDGSGPSRRVATAPDVAAWHRARRRAGADDPR